MSNKKSLNDLGGLIILLVILYFGVFMPLAVAHNWAIQETSPKTLTAHIVSVEVLPLDMKKTMLITWKNSQEVYLESGLWGLFKDPPAKYWLVYPGKAQTSQDLKNQKVWMKYVIKNRDLPIIEILEIRILKE